MTDTTDELAVLKPCPLCGEGASLLHFPPHKHELATFMPDHPGSWAIECWRCGLGLISDDRESLTAKWNTRADSARIDALEAEVARKDKALEQLLNDKSTTYAVRCIRARAALSPASKD